jgi:hypothetical protein
MMPTAKKAGHGQQLRSHDEPFATLGIWAQARAPMHHRFSICGRRCPSRPIGIWLVSGRNRLRLASMIDDLKRAGSSIAAAKVSDAMAPTPGTDVNNRAPGTLRAMAGTCFSKRSNWRRSATRTANRPSAIASGHPCVERSAAAGRPGEMLLHKAATALRGLPWIANPGILLMVAFTCSTVIRPVHSNCRGVPLCRGHHR